VILTKLSDLFDADMASLVRDSDRASLIYCFTATNYDFKEITVCMLASVRRMDVLPRYRKSDMTVKASTSSFRYNDFSPTEALSFVISQKPT
jgi:hypothetical protein